MRPDSSGRLRSSPDGSGIQAQRNRNKKLRHFNDAQLRRLAALLEGRAMPCSSPRSSRGQG